MVEQSRGTFGAIEPGKDIFKRAKVTADSGFHSKTVVAAVEQTGADAYIADRDYRKREPAFAKFDSPAERAIYSRRMDTVEPVFGNLQNKGMRRFTLRGRAKVSAQWQLYTMVHNIEKIAHRAQGRS